MWNLIYTTLCDKLEITLLDTAWNGYRKIVIELPDEIIWFVRGKFQS